MAKRWQKADVSYLQRYGKTKPVDELARRFNTDAKTVRAKLAELAPPARAKKPAPKPAARPAPKAAPKASPKTAAKPAPKAAPARPKPKAKPAAKPTPKPAPKAAAPRPAAPPRTTAATRAAAPKTAATPPPKAAPKAAAKVPALKAAAQAPAAKPKAPAAKPAGPDPVLAAYGDALKAMHKQDWARAVKLFEKVAGDDDTPDMAARARQYLAAARQRLEGEEARQDHEDAYLQAVFEKNRGNLAAALEICRRGGREKKDERFAYLAASIHALEGRSEEAAQALSQAVELNPKNRIHAYHDADFAELRKDHGFRQLFDFP